MIARWAAALLLLGASAAQAANAPHDLFGYFPGQTLEQARAVDATRVPRKCQSAPRCIMFPAEYLGLAATVAVNIDSKRTVKRIQVDVMSADQKPMPECKAMLANMLSVLRNLYGPGTEFRNTVWRDGEMQLTVSSVCMPATPGASGAVVVALEKAKVQQ